MLRVFASGIPVVGGPEEVDETVQEARGEVRCADDRDFGSAGGTVVRHGAELVREGFERNVVAYRCVRMIAEAAASVGFRAAGKEDALARLIAQPNIEQAGPDLLETFYGHLAVSGDAFIEAASIDGDVRELFVLRPDRLKALKGSRGWPIAWEHRVGSECGGYRERRMAFCQCFTCGCFIRRTIMRGTRRWKRLRGRWTYTTLEGRGRRR